MEPTRIAEQGGTADELALIRAARNERAPAGAPARALAALSLVAGVTAVGAPAAASTSAVAVLGKWLATGALLGAVSAGSVHVLSRNEPAPQRSASPSAQRPEAESSVVRAAPAEITEPAAQLEQPEPLPALDGSAPPPARSRAPSPQTSRSGTLAEERALLERARSAIGEGATGEASDSLARYSERFEHGALRDEASVLRIELALARGETARAVALCDAYLSAGGDGPHTARVRAMRARALAGP